MIWFLVRVLTFFVTMRFAEWLSNFDAIPYKACQRKSIQLRTTKFCQHLRQTHTNTQKKLRLSGMMQLNYLEGSISMSHTVPDSSVSWWPGPRCWGWWPHLPDISVSWWSGPWCSGWWPSSPDSLAGRWLGWWVGDGDHHDLNILLACGQFNGIGDGWLHLSFY